MRILLAEDDHALAQAVCSYLRAKAFVVDVATSLRRPAQRCTPPNTLRCCSICT